MHLIPQAKVFEKKEGFLQNLTISLPVAADPRLIKTLKKLPVAENGTAVDICITGTEGESYTLDIAPDRITICAPGTAGAFYAIQTLRQIFAQGDVPCLHIEDAPSLAYRGFYHDVTRGKVPTLDTLKQLVDRMAYVKLNSLQLYVEHTFPFKEYGDLPQICGCLTPEELKELDDYCKENFIDFIPSLSTFGHLYELLEQPGYRHLRLCQEPPLNRWRGRMMHHTIDPRQPESIEIIKSLIDQYAPCFTSYSFNICCDETFDLHAVDQDGSLYVDFVKKIISHTETKGKQVMMWADIALKYPQQIPQLPENVVFLNWKYSQEPPEAPIQALADRKQILCPGTASWSRLCENPIQETGNICTMAKYAKKYNALGLLNTNWGDWANPCSLELAMYGLSLGAAVSWDDTTEPGQDFDTSVDALIYRRQGGMALLRQLSTLCRHARWMDLCRLYYRQRYNYADQPARELEEDPAQIAEQCVAFAETLERETWELDEYRQEMVIAARCTELIARLLAGEKPDLLPWLETFSQKWLQKNKPSELFRIQEMITWLAQN